MKIILSRKGFDTGSGGCPSPIFPDGSMLALPIPDRDAPVAYQDLTWEGRNLGDIVSRLVGAKVKPSYRAHLDPDLIPGMRPRPRGWRPVFGQCAAAQGHLTNQGVGPGDLFLFFGLFRDVDDDGRFIRGSKPRHVLWGWLQIDKVLPVAENRDRLSWAEGHPHLGMDDAPANTLYVASDSFSLGDRRTTTPGAGTWPVYDQRRQLTAPDGRCSQWLLPSCFSPEGRKSALSYHGRPSAWTPCEEGVLLQTVGRGQEFALDCDDYPEALDWAKALLSG